MRMLSFAGLPLIGIAALAVSLQPLPAVASTGEAPVQAGSAPAAPVLPPASPAAAETPPAPADAKPATAEAPKPQPLPPTLIARINLTSQTMVVQAGTKTIHTWKVSTGAPGYATPPGTFKPGWMAKMWYSRQYDDAPMPHSVFFNGGIAVHATTSIHNLGRAASHGCVRLSPANAAIFYGLVTRHGMARTRIIVHGRQPFSDQADRVARLNNRYRQQAVTSGGNNRGLSPFGMQVASASQWYVPSSTGAGRCSASRIDSYSYDGVYGVRRAPQRAGAQRGAPPRRAVQQVRQGKPQAQNRTRQALRR